MNNKNQIFENKSCDIDLGKTWKKYLAGEFQKEYMINLKNFLKQEIKLNKTIYPHGKKIFNAFNLTPFENVKVVIIGQDPYHGPGQAEGLSFSVPNEMRIPPSLLNIYKELKQDLNIPIPKHGHLDKWARQGVLLLNTVLTVEKSKPASHKEKGWENFTDQVIKTLNEKKKNIIFILWGAKALKKAELIDINKHIILKGAHPSPFSAARGFFGKKYFSTANMFLKKFNLDPIDWDINTSNTRI